MAVIPKPNGYAFRGIPMPPRDLQSQKGAMAATVTWHAPLDLRGVVGYRVYLGSEKNLIAELSGAAVRTYIVQLPANTKNIVFLSSISALGRESPRAHTYVESEI